MSTEERLDRIERLIQQDAENIHELAEVARSHEAAIEAHHAAIVEMRARFREMGEETDRHIRELVSGLGQFIARQPKPRE